jgi:hypothetical protein
MKRQVWREYKYNSNKKLANNGQRPLGMKKDFIGNQGPEQTVALE